jgi:hypothetical protein
MKRALALALTFSMLGLGGCKAARKLFLGDPDAVPTARPMVPTTTSATIGITLPGPPPPPKQMTLPDGSLSSPEYADAYEAKAAGQLWRAHLALEQKAFGADGTKDELRLLRDICQAQDDTDCAAKCAARLGEKAPETELEKLQKLAKRDPKAARRQLEAKLEADSASTEEIALLHKLCVTARDKACIAKTAPAAPAPTATAAAGGDDAAKALALLSKDPKAARALLEPKVKAGKGSKDEIAALCAVCIFSRDPVGQKNYCNK